MKITYILAVLAGLFCLFAAVDARALGAPGEVDLSFDPGSGINGAVNTVLVQPDGRVLIGGEFTTVQGLARNRLARLLPDGRGDASFHVDISAEEVSTVSTLALQPDGKVLAGHTTGIVRLNPDGTRDTTFSPNVGDSFEDGTVNSIALQPDGKILIGGIFSKVNGISRNGLARLNANGSVDQAFFSGAILGSAWPLALQPDGKLLVQGLFNVDGTNRFALVRLKTNGSLDSSFDAHGGTGSARALSLQPDGKVLICGNFLPGADGNNLHQMARLHADGSLDMGYEAPAIALEQTDYIESMIRQPDGKILIWGGFAGINGTSRKGMARLNADGSLDGSFDAGPGVNGILAAALQADGKVIICGGSTIVAGSNAFGMARLQASGSVDNSFQPGAQVNDRVTSLLVQPDGRVLVGGLFTSIQGIPRPGIARFHPDGLLDRTFEPQIETWLSYSNIKLVQLQADGKVVLTGFIYVREGEVLHSRTIARLHADGNVDHGFQPDLSSFIPSDPCPPGYFSCENSVAAGTVFVQPDGRIIIGGNGVTCASWEEGFDSFYKPFFARFLPNGSLDSSFHVDAGIAGVPVEKMMRQPDGKLLVAGAFTVNGVRRGMIRLHSDGSLDQGFVSGSSSNSLQSMALQLDGKILIGGRSWMAPGTGWTAVARLHPNGSLDTAFHPFMGEHDEVRSLMLQPDGKLLIAGTLYATGSTANAHGLDRLLPDGTADPGFHRPRAPGFVMTAALQPDGHVLVAGDFTTVEGTVRPRVARINGDSPAPLLNIALTNDSATLSWPITSLPYQLHQSTDLSQSGSWSPVSSTPTVSGSRLTVPVPITAGRMFFRLAGPPAIQ